MTLLSESELREKLRKLVRWGDYDENGKWGRGIGNMDDLIALITQYGDTREREGIDRTLNLLEANLALCEWSDDISARKLWENMSEIHGLAALKEEPGDEQTNDQL